MEKALRQSKIINDPVHGFIEVPHGILLTLIDSPTFQRLRRIKQLGLGSMVYPGAQHTRFNHALGAMHLMRQALDVLRRKEVEISDAEYEATLIAILLHDIGHGPFSHALETAIIPGLHHEDMSLALMERLNREHKGALDLAIRIFTGEYARVFFHQMVSSQLDLDRMDYLIRDSFFSGVAEGVVGIDRIIKTLNVLDDKLVVESKGIYSVEKFIVSRRLMYWQVYLHKASVSAENMLVNILRRARELYAEGKELFLEGNLSYFFRNPFTDQTLTEEVIEHFIGLDDDDVQFHIKCWEQGEDRILAGLCNGLLRRNLIKTHIQDKPFAEEKVAEIKTQFCKQYGFTSEEAAYFVFTGKISNQAYLKGSEIPIMIWYKDGQLKDLAHASDMKNILALSAPVVKHFLCHPKLNGN